MATIIERYLEFDEDVSEAERPCLAHENTVLIRAGDREEAYQKAIELGEAGNHVECVDLNTRKKGIWVFEGLSSLLAVYDELEDGAELFWKEHSDVPVSQVESWVREKYELEAFDAK